MAIWLPASSPETAAGSPVAITTTKQISAVRLSAQDANIGSAPVQLLLPDASFEGLRAKAHRPRRVPRIAGRESVALETAFRVRLDHRHSPATARQYSWVLQDLVRLASRLTDRRLTAADLLREPCLLGTALATGERGGGVGQVSAWLTSQRRSVIRSFARLMAAELA